MALLLAGGRVLDPATGALEAADVLVEGERIAAVAPSLRVDGAEQVDADGRILIPGLVNAQIEPGRRADLVLLRADSPYLRPLNDPLNALVFAETGAAVDTVLVDGRVVVREGRVLGVDEGAIRDRAQAAVERLAASNRGSWELAEALAPYVAQACGAALASPATAARWLP